MLRAMKVYEGSGADAQKKKKKNSSSKENRTPIAMAMAAAANDTTNPIAKTNHNANTSNYCTNPNAKPCFPYPTSNPNPDSSTKSSSKENESPNTNTNTTISNPMTTTTTTTTTTSTTNVCNDLKYSADNAHTNANNTHTNSSANLSRGGGFFGYGKQSNILKKAAGAHTRQSAQDWFNTCQEGQSGSGSGSGPPPRPLLSRSNSSISMSRRRKKNLGESCGGWDSRFLESPTTPTHSSHVWDDPDSYGESHTAPASAWSTLATRALLCRPLPLDVGRCVCYITRERLDGVNCFALYTDEGYGRQDRKLAVAFHKRRAGKSEFVVFSLGLESNGKSSGAILGRVQANLLGTRFLIWDEAEPTTSQRSSLPPLLGVVMFQPTATTLTGSFRVMRVSIPKYQSTQIVPSTYRENGLAQDWEENTRNSYQLYSRKPIYNNATRSYELDFKDRTKKSTKIMTSARNLQLTMNENGKQTILMLGKIGKSKFLMEYRFPMTAYQAFSISLASMDSKLCCSL